MKVAFQDESFAFEFVRNLGFMYYGGSDLGEMMATAGRIKEGDEGSWFTEFDKLARRTLSRGGEFVLRFALPSPGARSLRVSFPGDRSNLAAGTDSL